LDGDKIIGNMFDLDNLMFVSYFPRWLPKLTLVEPPQSLADGTPYIKKKFGLLG